MSDELKVCECGRNAKVGFLGFGESAQVECHYCGRRGPWRATRAKAIAAWNRRVVTREQVEAAAKLGMHPTEWRNLDEGNRSLCIGGVERIFRAAGFEVAE